MSGTWQAVLTLQLFRRLVTISRVSSRCCVIAFNSSSSIIRLRFFDKPPKLSVLAVQVCRCRASGGQHYGVECMPLVAHDIGDSVALELLRRGNW